MTNGKSNSAVKFIAKPKPKFEPFNVGSSWRVELKGEYLHVGCQVYKAKEFQKALTTLRKFTCSRGDDVQLYAYRDGIGRTDRSGAEISWTDADKILAALEKAGV